MQIKFHKIKVGLHETVYIRPQDLSCYLIEKITPKLINNISNEIPIEMVCPVLSPGLRSNLFGIRGWDKVIILLGIEEKNEINGSHSVQLMYLNTSSSNPHKLYAKGSNVSYFYIKRTVFLKSLVFTGPFAYCCEMLE